MLGNIFGSNMFNVFITAITDIAYRKEAFHISTNLNSDLLLIGGCSALMTTIVLLAMKTRKTARWIAWESILTIGVYLTVLYALYQ